MPTKVNRTYWSGNYSAVTDFDTGECYRLDGSLKDWIDNNKWDINNGNEFDLSVCPWGLPECSFSSMATPVFMKTGGFGSSSKVICEIQESHRKNTPIFFNAGWTRTITDSYNADFARISNKRRIVGETEKSNTQTIKYTNTVENNTVYSLDEYGTNTAPVISFQYDSVRYVLGNIFLFDTTKTANFSNTYSTTNYNDLYNLINTEPTGNKYLICGCFTNIYIKHLGDQNNTNFKIRCCGKAKVPEYLGKQYFDSENTEYIDLSRCLYRLGGFQGKNANGSYGYTYGSGSSMYSNEVPTIKDTKSLEFGCSATSTCIANISAKKQVFDDVSYHWETRLYYFSGQLSGSGQRYELKTDDSMPIHSGDNAYYVNPYTFLIIDSHTYDDNYKAMCAALRHELAFIGLPFAMYYTNASGAIGDNNIYLPVFDYDHMITTGNYKSGTDALSLPNATWGDVFDTSVPAYDPNYIPPEPQPPEEHDRGDLYNIGARRFFWNSLKVHLLSAANYDQFVQKLNSLNMTDPDNETWQLQFKGLNPSDYIVGAYASFVKPPKNTATTIKLGPVDLEQSEYTYKESDSNAGFFTFGTRTINPEFNDFRDFAPYTMIELYLPLCGTIELDTAYFMGASVKIDYYYDIYTMSCTACIYRVKDNQELLYKTVNGTIGAQIPMLSGNMGAYQNQIKSIENAMKQNEMKVLTSTAVLAAGIVAAPMTSGTSLIAAGTATLSGAAGIASGLQKQAELDYQIEHIQPSMSVTGAADPQTDLCTGQLMPKLIIKRAEMLSTYNQTEYAKTIGHACCINDTLGYVEGDTESPRSGLVVCSSVDTSGIIQMTSESDYIAPTADEVSMIKQALSSGVIL